MLKKLFNLVEIEAKKRSMISNNHGGHSYMSCLIVSKNHQCILWTWNQLL